MRNLVSAVAGCSAGKLGAREMELNSCSLWSSPRPVTGRPPKCCYGCCSSPAAMPRSDSGHPNGCHLPMLLTPWPAVVDSGNCVVGGGAVGEEIVQPLERRPPLPVNDDGGGGVGGDEPRCYSALSPNCPRTIPREARPRSNRHLPVSGTFANCSWHGPADEPPPLRDYFPDAAAWAAGPSVLLLTFPAVLPECPPGAGWRSGWKG